MTKTNEYIQKAKDDGILVPRLSLAEKIVDEYGNSKGTKSTGKHTVKFIADKPTKGKDFQTGQEVYEMEYIFEENGNKCSYNRPLRDKEGKVHYFIQKMDEFTYGDMLILEYVPQGLKGFISVSKVDKVGNADKTSQEGDMDATEGSDEVADEDIPVIADSLEQDDILDQDNPLM